MTNNLLASLISGSGIPVKRHGVSGFPSGGGVTPIDDTGLKAYWKFSGSDTPVVNSSSASASLGDSADLDMTGGTYEVAGTPADLGTAVTFDGSDDYGVVGTSVEDFIFISGTSGLSTIIWWAKYLSTPAEVYTMATVDTEGTQVGFMIRNEGTKFRFHISRGEDESRTLSQISATNFIVANSWHMYSWSWDYAGSAPQSTIRRDNANEETEDRQNTAVSSANTYPFTFGVRPSTLSNDFVNMQICETSVWNKVVDDDTMASLYNSGDGREIY